MTSPDYRAMAKLQRARRHDLRARYDTLSEACHVNDELRQLLRKKST